FVKPRGLSVGSHMGHVNVMATDANGFAAHAQVEVYLDVQAPTPQPVVTPTPQPVVTPTPQPVVTPTPQPVLTPTPQPVVPPTPQPIVTPMPQPPQLCNVQGANVGQAQQGQSKPGVITFGNCGGQPLQWNAQFTDGWAGVTLD